MIVAISNRKGGVGKTTTAVNLGAALALRKRCLLVDLDPQASLTQSLGISSPDTSIYTALTGRSPLEPINVSEGLDVVPSTTDLAGAEVELANQAGREVILRQILRPFRRKYDFILIDCPPSLGVLTINALVAGEKVLAPMQTQFLSMQGLLELTGIIETVRERLNGRIELGGIVLTQYDGRKNLDREVVEEVGKRFKGKVFKTIIRSNVALAEAPVRGQDIFIYAPNSHGAHDYLELSKEFLKKALKRKDANVSKRINAKTPKRKSANSTGAHP